MLKNTSRQARLNLQGLICNTTLKGEVAEDGEAPPSIFSESRAEISPTIGSLNSELQQKSLQVYIEILDRIGTLIQIISESHAEIWLASNTLP